MSDKRMDTSGITIQKYMRGTWHVAISKKSLSVWVSDTSDSPTFRLIAHLHRESQCNESGFLFSLSDSADLLGKSREAIVFT